MMLLYAMTSLIMLHKVYESLIYFTYIWLISRCQCLILTYSVGSPHWGINLIFNQKHNFGYCSLKSLIIITRMHNIKCNTMHITVSIGVCTSYSGKWPLVTLTVLIFQYHDVTNFRISPFIFPFLSAL